MDKNGQITIAEFAKGQAISPYTGFASVVGCEVFDPIGVLKIGNRTMLQISTATLPIAEVTDPFGNTWTVTQNGDVYKNGVLIRSFAQICYDVCYFQGYILVRRQSSVSAYGPIASVSQGWTDFILALDQAYYGKMLVGTVEDINGAVYIGNGQYVATLKQNTGQVFAPGDGATFSYVSHAYTINNGFVTTFAEIGDLLAIGVSGGTSWPDRVNHTIADIHYWDKSSAKADSIVHFNEAGLNALVGKDNRIYAQAGVRGNLYVTDTTNYTMFMQIPWNNNRPFGTAMSVFPNAIGFNTKGNMLIGTSSGAEGYGADPTNSKHGVFEIRISGGYSAVLKHVISTGNVGATQPLSIGMIRQGASDSLSIGWQDGTSHGKDITDYNAYVETAYFETMIMYVAPRYARRSFQHLEFKLGKPLLYGQTIKLYARKNLNAQYKLIATFDFTTLGGVISTTTIPTLTDVELLQCKVTLTQPTTTTPPGNIELITINIW